MKRFWLWVLAITIVVWLVQYPDSAARVFTALATTLNHALATFVHGL
jgi:hypothetical protein